MGPYYVEIKPSDQRCNTELLLLLNKVVITKQMV